MKASIKTKLLVMSILVVILTTCGVSVTYFILTTRDKHEDSRQRIRIAFDIILDDLSRQSQLFTKKFEEFLQEDATVRGAVYFYSQDTSKVNAIDFVSVHFTKVADALKKFGHSISANRLTVYGSDNRLLAAYQNTDNQETSGIFWVASTGNDSYIAMDTQAQLIAIRFGNAPTADMPLPAGIPARYEGEIPKDIRSGVYREGQRLGFKLVAPILRNDKYIGVLVGEIFYTQESVERYAKLSETVINFFAGTTRSIGTFSLENQLDPERLAQGASCDEILTTPNSLNTTMVMFADQAYYHGQCVLKNGQEAVGAMTVNLSQQSESLRIRKTLMTVLAVSVVVAGIAFGVSVFFSRSIVGAIPDVLRVMSAAAEGDLRQTASVMSRDEIGALARNLNQMIERLREISLQIHTASYSVNAGAEAVSRQMQELTEHIHQQSASVEETAVSFEKINDFINMVAHNTGVLFSAAAQILSSIQETRASISEVTSSIHHLTTNLALISASVEQVNHVVKDISEHAENLENTAHHTETEIHHIHESLGDVSHHAAQTQQLARETMNAAKRGQQSVETSIQGITELKTIIGNTARIIQEIKGWGEQVGAILGMVNDITEQTSLLALNASIISAQAGSHGKGFAVVADEIKELATRTKSSTKEIGTLLQTLQKKTEEGVKNIASGIKKADQGVQLVSDVKESLAMILDSASRSANGAAETAQVIQHTTERSQDISLSMNHVTAMVSHIRAAIQQQEQDMIHVLDAVENISGMSEQVNMASLEQKSAAEQIESSMEHVIHEFGEISNQTEVLQDNATQIVTAMQMMTTTAENIVQNVTVISEDTVKNLVQQAEQLQQIVSIFKVS